MVVVRVARWAARASSGAGGGGGMARRAASTFGSAEEHTAWLESQAALPKGFRVGTSSFKFSPRELPGGKTAGMTLTVIALDAPTPSFAGMFTSNAVPGAPVLVGRKRLAAPELQAIVVNNKISNVCAPGGVEDSERICAALAAELRLGAAGSTERDCSAVTAEGSAAS
jgi:glutamate N-acetyltransferase/amino-acid N-acetyltransferase